VSESKYQYTTAVLLSLCKQHLHTTHASQYHIYLYNEQLMSHLDLH